MKKKLITVLLALTLSASMLSACGDDEAADSAAVTKSAEAEKPAEEAPEGGGDAAAIKDILAKQKAG